MYSPFAKMLLTSIEFKFLILSTVLLTQCFTENTNSKGWEYIFANNATSSPLKLHYYGSKVYYLGSNIKASYLNAVLFCETIHMKLLAIRDRDENDWIHKLIHDSNKGTSYWTSGARFLDGHSWAWMSYGIPIDYTRWYPGEPHQYLNEQCLLVTDLNNGLYWSEELCNKPHLFICERSESATQYNKPHIPEIGRSSNTPLIFNNLDFITYKNKAYYIAKHIKMNYMQAIQFCKLINMELVSIDSEEENARLSKYIRDTNAGNDWWSSGSKILDGKNWVWLNQGRSVEYTKWRKGEPNGADQLCLHLVFSETGGLEWADDYCHYAFNVICESGSSFSGRGSVDNSGSSDKYSSTRSNITTFKPIVPTGGHSDPEWELVLKTKQPGDISFRHYGGKKYHVEIDLMADQDQAKRFCSYHGMQLLEVVETIENEDLKKLILDTGVDGPYWTAGAKHDDKWIWSISQKPFTFTNWNTNKPTDKNCVYIDELAKWSDDNCSKKLYFICEASMFSKKELFTDKERCSAPIVNVYIDTNLFTDEGKRSLKKDFSSSKDVSGGNRGYKIEFTNNIDVSQNSQKNPESEIVLNIPEFE